jgi:F-type H+-transporting ATPase subunit gamma
MTNLLQTYPKAKKTGIILLTTNKGLVGSLNLNLASKLEEVDKDSEVLSELIVYGKKGKHLAIILNKHIAADFPKIDKTASLDEIYPIAQLVTKLYETGQYRQILIIYNHFVSTLVQKATIKQLLPFVSSFSDSHPHPTSPIKGEEPSRVPLPGREGLGEGGLSTNFDYLFEPDPKEVLDHLLPRIIESQIYQAILENDASEHSARMIMMKNATDAAGDLITDLTLTYNQIRQNKITTELAEITAGKIALE